MILFLTGAVIWPAQVRAQQRSSKIWRVAFLYPGAIVSPAEREVWEVFRNELGAWATSKAKTLSSTGGRLMAGMNAFRRHRQQRPRPDRSRRSADFAPPTLSYDRRRSAGSLRWQRRIRISVIRPSNP